MVAGAGAIGCLLGARLVSAAHDVVLLGRPALRDAVAKHGLRIEGKSSFHGPVPVVETPAAAVRAATGDGEGHEGGEGDLVDAVFLTCKAHATAELAAAVVPLCRPDGVVASLQNGIANDRKVLRHTRRAAVCLTSHGAMRSSPNTVHHTGIGPTVCGVPADAEPDAAASAFRILTDAGFDPSWTDDVNGAVWTKAAVNAAINPLGAVHGKTNGELLADHGQECRALAEEIYSLSRAAGIRLHADPVDATYRTLERTAQNRCSMLQDVEARRPTEIDQITGYFMRAARRLGYPLVRNEDMYRLVTTLEAEYLGEKAVLRRARQEAEAWELFL